jgi:hypothetical protein
MRLARSVCFAITACGMAVGSVWADGLSDNTSRMSSSASMSASGPDVMYYSPSSGVVLYDSDVDARMAQSCMDSSLGADCSDPNPRG